MFETCSGPWVKRTLSIAQKTKLRQCVRNEVSGSPPDFVRRLYVNLENRTSGCAVFYHQTRTIWLTQPGRFRDADLLKPFWDPLTAVSKPICGSKYPSFNVLNFFRTLLDYLNMYHYLGNTHVQNVCCTIFMSVRP